MIVFETIQNCIQTELHQHFWLKELLTLGTKLVNKYQHCQSTVSMQDYKNIQRRVITKTLHEPVPHRGPYRSVTGQLLVSCMLPDKKEHAVLAEAMSTVALKWILQQQSTLPTLVLCIHTITKYGNWVACRCCCHAYSLQFCHCRKLSAVVVLKSTTHHVSILKMDTRRTTCNW